MKTFKYSDDYSSAKKRNSSIELKLNCIKKAKFVLKWSFKKVYFSKGVLIERAHYQAILAEGGRTNRWDVLTEEGALTEGVRYLITLLNWQPL